MTSTNIYLSTQIKAMDESCGILPSVLTENAANNLYSVLEMDQRLSGRICVICGKGNNGGDGYALANLLLKKGCLVSVCAVETPASSLAIYYCDMYTASGGYYLSLEDVLRYRFDTIVDCIFGASLKGSVEGRHKEAIDIINKSGAYVLSADLPSGICADSDAVGETAVNANACCTFTAYKCAHISYPAKSYCGKVYLADIGIPQAIISKFAPYGYTNGKAFLSALPIRPVNSHKGNFGPLAVLCGNEEMPGAAYLACNAAYRTGAGLVRLYSDDSVLQAIRTMLPEVTLHKATSATDILGKSPKALLVGCGCGRGYDALIKELLNTTNIPTVVDADGINCIAASIESYKSVNYPLVITPHPGEMARLTGKTVEEVNSERINNTVNFAKEYGITTVLKGNCTVVASPNGFVYVNQTGNNGLSKGGSGDVLAGIIASLLAQGIEPFSASVVGVYIHGAAADELSEKKGVYSILPSEIAEEAGKFLHFR